MSGESPDPLAGASGLGRPYFPKEFPWPDLASLMLLNQSVIGYELKSESASWAGLNSKNDLKESKELFPPPNKGRSRHTIMPKGLTLALLLYGIWTLGASGLQGQTQPSVTLAWDPSTASDVSGYKVYYGGASQTYTNTISVGNV